MTRRRPLRFESEISWFILANVMDVVVTFLALRYSREGRTSHTLVESNPVANWFLRQWGIAGMVFLKFAVVALVVTIAEFVGRYRFRLARGLLLAGTTIVAGVVAYSVLMLIQTLPG